MKFTCTQENLLKGVSQTAPIAGRNSQLPILQYILLRAEHNTLTLTATDLEVGIRAVIGGKMDQDGGCVLPAKGFLEYVQQLPKTNPVTLERKGNVVHVSTKGFHAQFSSSDPDEYPLLPGGEKESVVVVSAEEICSGVSRTIFAAAREETRPEIRSVFFIWKEGKLRIVATDSFRLAEYIIQDDSHEDFSLLLPLSSAQELLRLFQGQKEIHITLYNNYVSFTSDGLELTSRLIDGQYPRYEDIIPTTHTTEVHVDRGQFLRALKTLSVFLPRDSRRVALSIMPDTNELVARVAGGDLGQGEVKLDIECDGESVDVLMNIQYLMDGITHSLGEACDGYFSGQYDPVVFRQTEKNSVYTYVVMPISAQ